MIIAIPIKDNEAASVEATLNSIREHGPYPNDHLLIVIAPILKRDTAFMDKLHSIGEDLFGGSGERGRFYLKTSSNSVGRDNLANGKMFLWTIQHLMSLPVASLMVYLKPGCIVMKREWTNRLVDAIATVGTPYLGEVVDGALQEVAVYPQKYAAFKNPETKSQPALWRFPSPSIPLAKRLSGDHRPAFNSPLIRVVGPATDETLITSMVKTGVNPPTQSTEPPELTGEGKPGPQDEPTAPVVTDEAPRKTLLSLPDDDDDDDVVKPDSWAKLKEPTEVGDFDFTDITPAFDDNTVLKAITTKKHKLKSLAHVIGTKDLKGLEQFLVKLGYETYSPLKWIREKK